MSEACMLIANTRSTSVRDKRDTFCERYIFMGIDASIVITIARYAKHVLET